MAYLNGEKIFFSPHINGYNNGYVAGRAFGQQEGRERERRDFWDAYQGKGTKGNYAYAFFNSNWKDTNYNPPYDICIGKNQTGASVGDHVFAFSYITDTKVNISFDPNLNMSAVAHSLFNNCKKLVTIRNLDLTNYLFQKYTNWFNKCTSLQNLNITGKIVNSGFNVSDCPLTHDSLMSIINALSTEGVPIIQNFAVKAPGSYKFSEENYGKTLHIYKSASYILSVHGTVDNIKVDFDGAVKGAEFLTPWNVKSTTLTPPIPCKVQGHDGYIYFFEGNDGLYVEASAYVDGKFYYGNMDIVISLSSASSTRSITLGAANLAKLTDAEKAQISQKGWSFA